MTKKQTTDKKILEIRKLMKTDKAVVGTERTLKLLKLGKIEKVYVTVNCPENVKNDLDYYNKISKFSIVNLKYPNEELGTICKKLFSISILGVKKESK